MITAAELKKIAPSIIKKYNKKSNIKAWIQVLNTLIPYFLLFSASVYFLNTAQYWQSFLSVVVLSFFIVRIFMLMHDCGHKSLFKTPVLNTIIGFFTGVFVGLSQYVWSQHHNFHHATNGDWEKYRGPLAILTLAEYNKLKPKQQKKYRLNRHLLMAPIGALMYFIISPRINWLRGSIQVILGKKSTFWNTPREYKEMTLNNIVLLSFLGLGGAMAGWSFFVVYLLSLSLAGAMGLIVFTIQHNFEDAYATNTQDWSYYQGALTGTSFLTFPKPIAWFGLDIAFHHIHHLSASIPNYNLAKCHQEYAHLFDDIKCIKLKDIAHSFEFILWDEQKNKLINIKSVT